MKRREKKLTMYELTVFRIRVQGELHANWTEYFGALSASVELGADGNAVTTLLSEPMDQGALVGLINQLNAFGVPVISVEVASTAGE